MATAKKAKLNKNARAWVKALRSGKYKQATGYLTVLDTKTGEITGHCCLGVACEIAKEAGVKISTKPSGFALYYNTEISSLPESVQQWLGLRTSDGEFLQNRKETDLTIQNDIGRKSFKQIARIIEQKAAELFV